MLTEEVKEDISRVKTFFFATSSKKGEPNVVAVGMLKVIDDDTIWAVDNYMDKTLKNLQENPRASILVWSPDTKGAWQVKGDVTILNKGVEYEEAKRWAKSRRETLPAKNLLVFKVTDIFNVKAGADAGKRVA